MNDQVDSLKDAMLQRARKLADEHLDQGNITRQKILQGAREKIHLMEQKELLAAKANAEKHYLRRVQSSEIQLQAELDRNRWGLVQTVMDRLQHQLAELAGNGEEYQPVFMQLLEKSAGLMPAAEMTAHVNVQDMHTFSGKWKDMVSEVTDKTISLSARPLKCSGGVRLMSPDGTVMIDNTFEGLLKRQQQTLQKVIFERLFATVDGKGALLNG